MEGGGQTSQGCRKVAAERADRRPFAHGGGLARGQSPHAPLLLVASTRPPPPCPPRRWRSSRSPLGSAAPPAQEARSVCPVPRARNTCARTSQRPITRRAITPRSNRHTDARVQRVGKMLGQGAFGVVMQAMKEETSEQVAVKQIPIKVDDDRHQEKIMVRCRWLRYSPTTSTNHQLLCGVARD